MSVDFEQVYRKYYTPMYRYLVSLTKDPDLAEEITQETFFKALRNIHTYDPSQKMLTWLCAIGKNTYYSEQKRRHRLAAPDETVPSEDDIVERLLDREDNTAILKIVHRLDELSRLGDKVLVWENRQLLEQRQNNEWLEDRLMGLEEN